MVQRAPAASVGAGILSLALVHALSSLTLLGWAAGVAYLVVSNVLLAAGLRRAEATRFGWANATTATRSTLVGVVTALVVTSATAPIAVPLLIGLTITALLLDAVDGWVARHTGSESELGARFDMEVDAFLLLVLSAYAGGIFGWWVLAIGLLRYAFVAAGWILPWMRRELPFRYWRKVATAVAGVALTAAASGLPPVWLSVSGLLLALGLLLESFGRDVLWLARSARVSRTASAQ